MSPPLRLLCYKTLIKLKFLLPQRKPTHITRQPILSEFQHVDSGRLHHLSRPFPAELPGANTTHTSFCSMKHNTSADHKHICQSSSRLLPRVRNFQIHQTRRFRLPSDRLRDHLQCGASSDRNFTRNKAINRIKCCEFESSVDRGQSPQRGIMTLQLIMPSGQRCLSTIPADPEAKGPPIIHALDPSRNRLSRCANSKLLQRTPLLEHTAYTTNRVHSGRDLKS